MSSSAPKIYKPNRGKKIIPKILLIIFVTLVILFFLSVFGFRKYIAYTETGKLYLDVPWLENYMAGPPAEDELAEQLTATAGNTATNYY